ncbi:c1q globular head like domain containing protein [Caudoviricetes sp.]|nr:c1q globular head like domain containing protein [Caudoviricetes sp.]
MANIILQGGASGTGSTTITGPSTNNTNTVTLPDTTGGSIMVSSNMPAFSAYQSIQQTISTNTFTKVQFQTKEFDTANSYDNTTNYRFTPNVAGYYQVNSVLRVTTATNNMYLSLYKNGSSYKIGNYPTSNACSLATLVYLNGTTDYIEMYIYMNTGQTLSISSDSTFFQACLVRTA